MFARPQLRTPAAGAWVERARGRREPAATGYWGKYSEPNAISNQLTTRNSPAVDMRL